MKPQYLVLLVTLLLFGRLQAQNSAISVPCLQTIYTSYSNIPGNKSLFDASEPGSLMWQLVRHTAVSDDFERVNASSLNFLQSKYGSLTKIPGMRLRLSAYAGFTKLGYYDSVSYVDHGDHKCPSINRIPDSSFFMVEGCDAIVLRQERVVDERGVESYSVSEIQLHKYFPGIKEPIVVFRVEPERLIDVGEVFWLDKWKSNAFSGYQFFQIPCDGQERY